MRPIAARLPSLPTASTEKPWQAFASTSGNRTRNPPADPALSARTAGALVFALSRAVTETCSAGSKFTPRIVSGVSATIRSAGLASLAPPAVAAQAIVPRLTATIPTVAIKTLFIGDHCTAHAATRLGSRVCD